MKRLPAAAFVLALLASPFLRAATANQPPVAQIATVIVTQNTPRAITLGGSDPESAALTFAVTTQPLNGTLSGTAPNLTFTPKPGFTGGDSFTFTASDGQATSLRATISINVAPAGETNQPPVTQLTYPLAGRSFAAGEAITMRATASDPDGTISQVSFYSDGIKVGASTTPPYEFVWTNPTPGPHLLTSKAFDSGAFKMFSFSSPVPIYVVGPTQPTPPAAPATYTLTVVNGTGGGAYAAGATVSLSANAAPAGKAFSAWTGAAVANAASPNTTLTMPAANASVTATYQALPPPPPVPPAAPANPILFVTQIPVAFDFATVGSAFANHRPTPDSAGRGGDLYIRYADGVLRNLTAAAGYGVASGFQGANSIAVREPSVHWNGQKAIFSMVVGAPATQFASSSARWQLYEITGFGPGETPVITLVPNQPAYNNVSPCYGTDGRIIFSSDRPRNGQSHLYPQLDEYELAPTTTGLWSLDPATGDLFNLNHTPSGAFSPSIDSFGRVIFVRWDHLQRDQEADTDNADEQAGRPPTFGTFNYSDEGTGAQVLAGNRTEVFPEPRFDTGNTAAHTFNIFFPWMIQEDGTEEETINHVGRHELIGYMGRALTDDPNVVGFNAGASTRFNGATYIYNFLHAREDPAQPGRYIGTDAPEFQTHASGQLVAINASPSTNADQIALEYLTDPATKLTASAPAPGHTGHYRDPLPLSNGTLVAAHTAWTDVETRRGVGADYTFRLKTLWRNGTYWEAYQPLTSGFTKSVSYYANGALVNYSGPLWELNPVEVRARPIPQGAKTPLGAPEQQVFAEEGVSVVALQNYLRANNLALVVSRNVTTRDRADRLQPFNLRVANTGTQTIGAAGKIYDVSHLQFFQADQIRGFGLRNAASTPSAGRRVLAQPLHDTAAVANNLPNANGPAGSVQLGADGSMAAFLPARRATTWQLTDPAGTPTVRERYWLTFQPGEIRACTSCHGINQRDQANHFTPTNKPEALRTLLRHWKTQTGN